MGHFMLKNYQKVLCDCKLARELDPKWVKTYYREGETYLKLEEYGEAAASYWEGLKR